jgi:hypothetical protein
MGHYIAAADRVCDLRSTPCIITSPELLLIPGQAARYSGIMAPPCSD